MSAGLPPPPLPTPCDFLWVEAPTVTRLRLSVCPSFCLQSEAAAAVRETERERERASGGCSAGHILGLSRCRSSIWIVDRSSPLPLFLVALLQLVLTSCRAALRGTATLCSHADSSLFMGREAKGNLLFSASVTSVPATRAASTHLPLPAVMVCRSWFL